MGRKHTPLDVLVNSGDHNLPQRGPARRPPQIARPGPSKPWTRNPGWTIRYGALHHNPSAQRCRGTRRRLRGVVRRNAPRGPGAIARLQQRGALRSDAAADDAGHSATLALPERLRLRPARSGHRHPGTRTAGRRCARRGHDRRRRNRAALHLSPLRRLEGEPELAAIRALFGRQHHPGELCSRPPRGIPDLLRKRAQRGSDQRPGPCRHETRRALPDPDRTAAFLPRRPARDVRTADRRPAVHPQGFQRTRRRQEPQRHRDATALVVRLHRADRSLLQQGQRQPLLVRRHIAYAGDLSVYPDKG
jgi:hypothetical protein